MGDNKDFNLLGEMVSHEEYENAMKSLPKNFPSLGLDEKKKVVREIIATMRG